MTSFKIFFILLGLLFHPSFAAAKGGATKIPLRFGILGGYQDFKNSYDADGGKYSLSGPSLGLDIQVPFEGAHTVAGATGWVGLTEKSSVESNTFMIGGPYVGFTSTYFEVFVGGGYSLYTKTLEGTAAAPEKKIDLSASASCGFAGTRYYFNKTGLLALGVTGYACSASKYKKQSTSLVDVVTETTRSEKATSSGVMGYLLISFGKVRK